MKQYLTAILRSLIVLLSGVVMLAMVAILFFNEKDVLDIVASWGRSAQKRLNEISKSNDNSRQ